MLCEKKTTWKGEGTGTCREKEIIRYVLGGVLDSSSLRVEHTPEN